MGTNGCQFELSEALKFTGLLKFELLASGLRVSDQAKEYVLAAKGPVRSRSGASGGLDLILPHDIHVNCPVNERFASESDLVLDVVSCQLVIRRSEDILAPVKLQPVPDYYGLTTSDGVPMAKIGQMCSGDRFCYGMTGPYCRFWKRAQRCKFCSIGLNRDEDASHKTVDQVIEALEEAVKDPALPAKHVLVGGGTPDGEDMGAVLASELCLAIKRRFDISCYVMICAPLKNEYIDMLRDAGVDELGMNIEFFSDAAWRELIPGKHRHIGRKRYIEALEYAVRVFGPINTRSLIIVGLEDPEYTVEGAEELASMGVMPILSPFRPLSGAVWERHRGFDHLTYYQIYTEVHHRAMHHGVPTGPTCLACQNNTLALPVPGCGYRFY